jgi:peptidoglycan/xylan/chitin deacetylase (PgdA/CDA1 family)
MPRKLFLTFDVEDFISRSSITALQTVLELLKKHRLKALFFITGHMAEKLRDFPHVLEMLDEHQIGYHSSGHSVHPTVFEFTDVEDYGKAHEISLKRETSHINPLTGETEGIGGIKALRDLFPDKQIAAFRAPGNCWSPPHLEALKSLGITYDFSADIAKNPVDYKGITFYPYQIIGQLEGKASDYRSLFLSLRHKVIVTNMHPSLLFYQSEWDAIYHKSNPQKLTEPQMRSQAEITLLINKFDMFLKEVSCLQKIGLVEVTPQLEKAERTITISKEKVEKCYQTSVRWALKQEYKPKFMHSHFFRFFEVKE